MARQSTRPAWRTRTALTKTSISKVCIAVGLAVFLYMNIVQKDILVRHSTTSSAILFPQPEKRPPCTQYAVMIDAGSTASRVHVYRFNDCEQPPVLEKEYFLATEKTPEGSGLTSYKFADAAASSLDPLLRFAQRAIPADLHAWTPIAVKATAGLRLLGEEASSHVLQAVRARLAVSHFLVGPSDPNGGAEVMTGQDEAAFSWMTTTYLLQSAEEEKSENSTSLRPFIFDMGGASLQVAFPTDLACEAPHISGDENKRCIQVHGRDTLLYQRSHLGFGLKSARDKVYQVIFRDFIRSSDTNSLTASAVRSRVELKNPCLAPGTRLDHVDLPRASSDHDRLKEQKVRVTMVGLEHANIQQCHALLERVTQGTDTDTNESCAKPPCSPFADVTHQSVTLARNIVATSAITAEAIYILSFFYDRIYPLGMLNPFTIKDLYSLTAQVCSGDGKWQSSFGHLKGAVPSLRETPEWCLDLSYMCVLLHVGFGLSLDQMLITTDKIGDMEIGWSLGASLQMLKDGGDEPHRTRSEAVT